MSIQREILYLLAHRFWGRKDPSDFAGGLQGRGTAILNTVKHEAVFIVLSLIIALFFAVVGLYELIAVTPLSEWFSEVWQTIMNASPQSISDIPGQIAANDLTQRTVGDWLNYIPSFLKQALPIILSPLDALMAIIILGFAIVIRLGGFALGQGGFARGLSWVLLVLSFAPLFLDYYIW